MTITVALVWYRVRVCPSKTASGGELVVWVQICVDPRERGARPGVLDGECGGVLLSHILSGAVPSPCQALASGFGMGPGVSPGPWPPQIFNSSSHRSGGGWFRVAVREPEDGRDVSLFRAS